MFLLQVTCIVDEICGRSHEFRYYNQKLLNYGTLNGWSIFTAKSWNSTLEIGIKGLSNFGTSVVHWHNDENLTDNVFDY